MPASSPCFSPNESCALAEPEAGLWGCKCEHAGKAAVIRMFMLAGMSAALFIVGELLVLL